MRLAASGESSSALPCEQQQQKHHHHHHQHPAHIRGFLGSVGDRLATTCFLTSVVMSSGRGQVSRSDGPVVRSGHLRKYKTLKKKFFVLRGDAPGHPACLEYYDSKKKYDNRSNPKRSITMRSCFNINRRVDTKHMHVIALYTKDECFSLILDNEKELDEWLNAMLLLSGDVPDGEQPRPTFEHVWQVTMQKKGLGERKNILGVYRLCLTDRTLSLVKVGAKDSSDSLEFPLISVRRCGYMERIFYMEVGRSTVTGDGELWMEAEDNNIAHNMHAAIMNAMSSSRNMSANSNACSNVGTGTCAGSKDDVGPRQRFRSSSANEASKPISVLQRRHTGAKLHGFSPLEEQRSNKEQVDPLRDQYIPASAPSQCSQSQSTSSSNTLTAVAGTGNFGTNVNSNNGNYILGNVSNAVTANRRRHSVASHPHIANNSHTVNSTIMTVTTTTTTTAPPTSTTTATTTILQQQQQQQQQPTSTTNATKSHQRTMSLPLAAVVVNQTQSSKRSVLRCVTGRDRCDSLPSRARTTSEGHPTPVILAHPRGGHLAPHVPRPHSMYGRGLSYSPPISSMPISPASGACSTDSAGSSLSMDEGTENILEETTASLRYGHSLTPDEPVILEENIDDYAPWLGTHQTPKYSPNFKSHSPSQQNSYVEMYSPCGSSPGRGGGSMSAAYMPMSPATSVAHPQSHQPQLHLHHHHHHPQQPQQQQQQQQQPPQQQQPQQHHYYHHHHQVAQSQAQQQQQQHNHSRGSSLVDEMALPDGYVPMAPVGDDGYVDMDPSNGSQHNGHFPDDMSQHGGSTCSVTSGTPSTDLRFSEYHLDKVTSYLATGEEIPARPTRAYSVGSRPEPASRHRKNRLDIAQQESSRVRAFSVGSRSKRPEIVGRLASIITARLPSNDSPASNKSNSAPLLSSSWGHNSGCSVASERMEDLMELDFTKPNIAQEANINSPPSLSYSHTQSLSTATDTSSYVDMSPGQPHASGKPTTASYVDMSGINKINRNNNGNNNNNINNNNNNNNNTTTANHNHNHNNVQATTSMASIGHKPVIKTLKPVEEAEGAYMRMESTIDEWNRPGSSPKQTASPMQDDYMQMNGPPGMTRTAPVDLPQPRRPPEGYVEMTFKSRPSLDQDYINMSTGASSSSQGSAPSSADRSRSHRNRNGDHTEKSPRSQPIAIQASTKSIKAPSFLPLNGSPMSESLASTPASPPRATPTGSNATIFPFSLNSPQSPIKPFTPSTTCEENGQIYSTSTIDTGDYAVMAPGIASSSTTNLSSTPNTSNPMKCSTEVPHSSLTKRLTELALLRNKSSRNSSSISQTRDERPSTSTCERIAESREVLGFRSLSDREINATSRHANDATNFPRIKSSRNYGSEGNATGSLSMEQGATGFGQNSQQELPTSPLTKRLGDLSLTKAKLVQPSPNTSPTPSAGFRIIQGTQKTSGKIPDEGSGGTPTPTATPTPTPSPLDSEGYEKLQPGAAILHYASLDLPEVGSGAPVSPTPVSEGFNYAEIDFAKLKQN